MNLPLKERLEKAASLVGIDSFVCTASGPIPRRCEGRVFVSDVGCDHAYLSLFLVMSGLADGAVASDVRQGPLDAAKANISRFGCEGKIETLLTDGLCGIAPYEPTDILICGMGGETIMTILNEAPFVKEKRRRLILQPMTGVAEVALFLSLSGFHIFAERYAIDDKKPYRILGAVYDGIQRELPLVEALTGELYFPEDRDAYLAFCHKMASTILKKADGIRARGGDAYELDALRLAVLEKASSQTRIDTR